MFCPVCRAEFREGFTECNNCRVNLVEDLENITEKIKGEILLCRACELAYDDENLKFCEECGLRLIRAVALEDEYVFLEKPKEEYVNKDNLSAELPFFEHLVKLPEGEGVVLVESEDMEMLVSIQRLLNHENIDFELNLPEEKEQPLGTLLGSGSPLERDFPQILVKRNDEEKAIRILAADDELGLAELPPELMEEDEEDEE
jgi:hypothetical protein